jgi:coproporphyrinogen III oxidase-like Fe-S oxidoreductase
MASPAVEASLRSTVGKVDYEREARYYELLTEALSDSFEPASCWTFSRTGGGMIDEYIVDYEDYVGIGSGAFSFLEGSLYVNTFSLAEYGRRLDAEQGGAVRCRTFGVGDKMRYRFLMSLFAMSLDKRRFEQDFGIDIERGLPLEMAFMRSIGAFSLDNSDRLELSPKGRYLLVAMMRQFFIAVNNLRDQAREALSGDERRLLFGEGDDAHAHDCSPVLEATATTQLGQEAPRPR